MRMTEHAVVIAGGGPTGLMLAGELALAGVDVAIVERRASQDLAGSRAGGLHSRTIEVLDQRGIADRFLSQGQVAQVAGFAWIRLDISDFPTRHNYGLALWQSHIERILAGWVGELAVPGYFEREVQPYLNDRIVYHGPVGGEQRIQALGRARALLHLINFDEPFGLSVIEAMACGTPVIAVRRGSMPELIADGETGLLVALADAAAEGVDRVGSIDRAACRRAIETRFSVEAMADRYIALYREILARG